MAHAYETFATGGKLVTGRCRPGAARKRLPVPGPVGIERIDQLRKGEYRAVELDDGTKLVNKWSRSGCSSRRSPPRSSAILQTVVKDGSATRAQIPGVMVAGKTGTTESYGDAWFVGWTKEYTVAVWVGYPDKFKPMAHEFQGEPVAGGTSPGRHLEDVHDALLKVDPLPKDDGGDGTGRPTPTPGDRRRRRAGRPPTARRAAGDDGAAAQAGARRDERTAGRRAAARPTDAAAADRERRSPRRRPATAGRGPPDGAAGRTAGTRGRRAAATARERRAQAGWPRAGDVAGAEGAEAPGELRRLGDADPRAGDVLERLAAARSRPGRRSARCRSRPARCRAPG